MEMLFYFHRLYLNKPFFLSWWKDTVKLFIYMSQILSAHDVKITKYKVNPFTCKTCKFITPRHFFSFWCKKRIETKHLALGYADWIHVWINVLHSLKEKQTGKILKIYINSTNRKWNIYFRNVLILFDTYVIYSDNKIQVSVKNGNIVTWRFHLQWQIFKYYS